MSNYVWDVYQNIRKLGISPERAEKIMSIVESGYISKRECENLVSEAKEEADETLRDWKKEKEEYDKLLNDPYALLERLVGDIVCKHLNFGNGSFDPYSSNAELRWDKESLGSVTLRTYSED